MYSKNSSKEIHSKNNLDKANIEIPKKGQISPEEWQQLTDELRLA